MNKLQCHAALLCLVLALTTTAGATDRIDFEDDVAPILIKRCIECHQKGNASGGLALTTRAGLLAGGESGDCVNLTKPQESFLLERIHDGDMPPAEKGRPRKLPEHEIRVIEQWLTEGARWNEDRTLDYFERTNDVRAGRDWWSLQPIVRPRVPTVDKSIAPVHPVDAFIQARLQQHQMEPAPKADKRTLLRRVYYDLIGLPPTEQQIAAFEQDTTSEAWDRVIDGLLSMPQYGERWGRFWLDLARYGDTSGYERDHEKPFAWKYRDWVVAAFNSDMPYSDFVVQQIAGDEIHDKTEQSVIATGFLRVGPWNSEPNDAKDYTYDRLEDMVHTTASTFLALTVKCARCHSHKFDPITQEDYYRMASVFWAGPIEARGGKAVGGSTYKELGVENVLGWTDLSPKPRPLHLLKYGERLQPQQEVKPGSLTAIPVLYKEFDPPPTESRTSLRRLQLAKWIAEPRNPLPARVLVNRIWQHHFGQAIVRTPNNFGFMAAAPTHPKLLDWLAAEFLENGGHIKQLHRIILTSQTWQQAVHHPRQDDYMSRDSGNKFCWHTNRRRLDAEALRDSLLEASGELDLTVGGESFRATISPEALEGLSRKSTAWKASPPEQQRRRSIYSFLKRGMPPPMMTTFDLCDATQSCGQRNVTIVPTQALVLRNNRFVHDRSESLATTSVNQHGDGDDQIRHVWSSILKRQPDQTELALASQHLAQQRQMFQASTQKTEASGGATSTEVLALASLCNVLMNSNEFIFID